MPHLLVSVAAVLAAYLLGSLAFAVLISRLWGLRDPRTFGSGNPGATNVLRSGSKAAAAVTLLLDACKGWLPVMLVQWLGPQAGLGAGTTAAVAVAAFAGHLWPVFFGFQGGKGVATFLGVVVGLSPWLGLASAATWLIIAFFFRYSSLASLITAVFAPVFYVMAGGVLWDRQAPVAVALLAMSALLVWRHRGNISRLLQGTEARLGAQKNTPQ